MEKPIYRAWCKKCGHTVKTADSRTFLTPFCLPQRCPNCHRYHNKYATFEMSRDSLYQSSFGYWKFVADKIQPKLSILRPSTWRVRGEYKWIDWDEEQEEAAEAI